MFLAAGHVMIGNKRRAEGQKAIGKPDPINLMTTTMARQVNLKDGLQKN